MIKKPLLAHTIEDITKIQFPVLVSPKYDGIRCLVINGVAYSRNMKLIPNKHVQRVLREILELGQYSNKVFDGELIIQDKQFNEISSGIMSEEGTPDFTYVLFDWIDPIHPNLGFSGRLEYMPRFTGKHIKISENTLCDNEEQLRAYEKHKVEEGFEGVMVRSLNGVYKQGRSTLNEGILGKLKRFKDSEAIITDVVELMKNNNEKTINELGQTSRSSHKANKEGMDTLGTFIVKDIHNNVSFEIGTGQGLTKELRKQLWDCKESVKGKIIKYRYQECGTKDKPRFPSFIGFRHESDIGGAET